MPQMEGAGGTAPQGQESFALRRSSLISSLFNPPIRNSRETTLQRSVLHLSAALVGDLSAQPCNACFTQCGRRLAETTGDKIANSGNLRVGIGIPERGHFDDPLRCGSSHAVDYDLSHIRGIRIIHRPRAGESCEVGNRALASPSMAADTRAFIDPLAPLIGVYAISM